MPPPDVLPPQEGDVGFDGVYPTPQDGGALPHGEGVRSSGEFLPRSDGDGVGTFLQGGGVRSGDVIPPLPDGDEVGSFAQGAGVRSPGTFPPRGDGDEAGTFAQGVRAVHSPGVFSPRSDGDGVGTFLQGGGVRSGDVIPPLPDGDEVGSFAQSAGVSFPGPRPYRGEFPGTFPPRQFPPHPDRYATGTFPRANDDVGTLQGGGTLKGDECTPPSVTLLESKSSEYPDTGILFACLDPMEYCMEDASSSQGGRCMKAYGNNNKNHALFGGRNKHFLNRRQRASSFVRRLLHNGDNSLIYSNKTNSANLLYPSKNDHALLSGRNKRGYMQQQHSSAQGLHRKGLFDEAPDEPQSSEVTGVPTLSSYSPALVVQPEIQMLDASYCFCPEKKCCGDNACTDTNGVPLTGDALAKIPEGSCCGDFSCAYLPGKSICYVS